MNVSDCQTQREGNNKKAIAVFIVNTAIAFLLFIIFLPYPLRTIILSPVFFFLHIEYFNDDTVSLSVSVLKRWSIPSAPDTGFRKEFSSISLNWLRSSLESALKILFECLL